MLSFRQSDPDSYRESDEKSYNNEIPLRLLRNVLSIKIYFDFSNIRNDMLTLKRISFFYFKTMDFKSIVVY